MNYWMMVSNSCIYFNWLLIYNKISLFQQDLLNVMLMTKFDIIFEVPSETGNAICRLKGITSHTPFPDFLALIAEKMRVGLVHLVQIGYVPLYKPKSSKPVPTLLENKEAWYDLLNDVSEFIRSCQNKCKDGKGFVKPSIIHIVDTSSSNDKEKKVSNIIMTLLAYLLLTGEKGQRHN